MFLLHNILVYYIICAFAAQENRNFYNWNSNQYIQKIEDSRESSSNKMYFYYNPASEEPLDLSISSSKKVENTHSHNNIPNPSASALSYYFSPLSILPPTYEYISTSIAASTPPYFTDILDKDILQIYIDSNFILSSSSIKEKLAKCKVLWMCIENIKENNNIEHMAKYISFCPPNTSLIFQWMSDENINSISTNHSISKSKRLSTILKNTNINSYISPFLLFINPNTGFLEISRTNSYTSLYRLFFSDPNSLVPLRKYSSLYFLHTCNSEIFSKVEKSKTYQNMFYYHLLHPNLKYYGIVYMKQDVSIPFCEIIPFIFTLPTSIDYFLIYQPYTLTKVKYIDLFFSINPKKIEIPFEIWCKVSISLNINTIRLNHLIARDIMLNSILQKEVFRGTKRKIDYEFSSQLNYPNYIKNIFYHSNYIYNNIFINIYPTINNLDLYFRDEVDNFNNRFSSIINLNLKDTAMLFAFAAIFFFDAHYIHLHLPSSYCLHKLHTFFSPSNFTPFSSEEISEFIKSILKKQSKNLIKDAIINLSDILSSTTVNQIILKRFWNSNIYRITFSSSNCLQTLCDSLINYGLFLSSSNTQTITLDNGTQKVALVSYDKTPSLTISFEDSKKILCFKRFYLPTHPQNS